MEMKNEFLAEKSISKEDSMRITALRFILIVLVVFIHNNLNADDALYYHLDFLEPSVITYFKLFVVNVLGGASVPLFFLFSGYLQFSKEDSYPVFLKKRAKSLLLPYFLWTFISVILFFIGQSIPATSPFFQNSGNNIVREWTLKDYLNLFWIHNNGTSLHTPLVYQFWFVRDLIVLGILSPVLKFIAKKLPFLFLVMMTLCYMNGLSLGFGRAIFFYMAGFFFAEYNISFFRIADKIRWIEYALLLLFVLAVQIWFADKISFSVIGTIISCLFFCRLSGAIIKQEKLFSPYICGIKRRKMIE